MRGQSFMLSILYLPLKETKDVITGSVAFSKANLRDMHEFFVFTHWDKSTI